MYEIIGSITVYIRASILSAACSHVPDIKLLMKYLLGLQAWLQLALKPPLSPKTSQSAGYCHLSLEGQFF